MDEWKMEKEYPCNLDSSLVDYSFLTSNFIGPTFPPRDFTGLLIFIPLIRLKGQSFLSSGARPDSSSRYKRGLYSSHCPAAKRERG